jgi:hypothetical protein
MAFDHRQVPLELSSDGAFLFSDQLDVRYAIQDGIPRFQTVRVLTEDPNASLEEAELANSKARE